MNYINWLQNRNLSKKTINIYIRNANIWQLFLCDKKPTISLFVKYINEYSKNHNPSSTRLMYASIMSFLKFNKSWKLLNECRLVRMPKLEKGFKDVVSIRTFLTIFNNIPKKKWIDRRNWLIFAFLLFTGIRVSELIQFNKNNIIDKNKFIIRGKGNKYRTIYLSSFIINLLEEWENNRIAISTKNKILTTKQINLIVKKISNTYFNKNLTPHSLRRSFATHLLSNDINIEIIKKILGHATINTTLNYVQYTESDVVSQLKKVFSYEQLETS